VQVIERKAPAVDPAAADYTRIREQLAENSAAAARSLVVAELIEAEERRTAPVQP